MKKKNDKKLIIEREHCPQKVRTSGIYNESIESLESENEELTEQLDKLMNNNGISQLKNGKYTKKIRMVCYDLLSLIVKNWEKVVKTVLEKLAGKDVERLPKKSLSGMMMVEAQLLAQMQAVD